MQLFKHNLQLPFSNWFQKFGLVSLTLVILSIIILVIHGLNLSIEFTGGTKINVSLPNTNLSDFRVQVDNIMQENIEVVEIHTSSSISQYMLRMKFTTDEENFINNLKMTYPELSKNSIDSFGPKLGKELQTNARNAILIALFLISLYIAIRFDRYYALGSLAALAHDILITLGILSICNIEIGISVIAGLLTIVGYSLNDTIVIYDRIRENNNKMPDSKRADIINRSLNESLNRTVITSITTFLVITTLFLFGGVVLKTFSLTLIVGVFIGTYSSIFIASPIMLYFEDTYPIPEFIEEK